MPHEEIERRISSTWATLTSSKIHEWKCSQGHVNKYWLSPHLYDLLYSKALTDLARSDTRSAIANFYSAWENFVAHSVKLIFEDSGFTARIPSQLSRAEPLLGAYTALYIAKVKKAPQIVRADITKIRNEVIHGDSIPSEIEAKEVAKEVQRCIQSARKDLHPLHDNFNLGPKAAERATIEIQPSGFSGVSTVYIRSQIDDDIDGLITAIRHE